MRGHALGSSNARLPLTLAFIASEMVLLPFDLETVIVVLTRMLTSVPLAVQVCVWKGRGSVPDEMRWRVCRKPICTACPCVADTMSKSVLLCLWQYP